MSETSRSCARCRRPAVVARGSAAYCMDCNRIMEWSEVIAIVQNAEEPPAGVLPSRTATAPPRPVREEIPIEFGAGEMEPALTGGGGEAVEADPFSQRLI